MFHWEFLITFIFSRSLKFGACYITGQWGEFTVKNTTLCLNTLFLFIFLFFVFCFFCFSSKNLCFHHFHLFSFDDVLNFFDRISANQKWFLPAIICLLLTGDVCKVVVWKHLPLKEDKISLLKTKNKFRANCWCIRFVSSLYTEAIVCTHKCFIICIV